MKLSKKLLLFKIKTFCYDSPYYFIDRCASHFKNAGWDVEIFDSSRCPLTELDSLSGRRFDAILDFNSALPRLDTTENIQYLDTIDAPFFNYILDHPLFHHDSLKFNLKNYHVICIDIDHVNYIKKYYPHIRSVSFLPLAGSSSDDIPFDKRSIPLLFSGTYTSPESVMELINEYSGSLKEEMHSIIEILLENPSLTCEEALKILLKNYNASEEDINFPVRMHSYFLAYTYVCALFRKNIISELVKAKIPMTIIGHGWRHVKELSKAEHVKIFPPVSFADTFSYMADSKMVLNIMPWFKNGLHDRIFSSMLCKSVCLTDDSACLNEYFDISKDLILYDINRLDILGDIVSDAFKDGEKLQLTAQNGYKKASLHTWEAHCRKLSEIFKVTLINRENTDNPF